MPEIRGRRSEVSGQKSYHTSTPAGPPVCGAAPLGTPGWGPLQKSHEKAVGGGSAVNEEVSLVLETVQIGRGLRQIDVIEISGQKSEASSQRSIVTERNLIREGHSILCAASRTRSDATRQRNWFLKSRRQER